VNIVVDASVAIKWAIHEDGHREAVQLIDEKNPPIAPHFVLVECANVLWKKVARNELNRTQAQGALDLVARAFVLLVPDEDVLPSALKIAVELSHPVYDCLYLACADRLGTKLVTDDLRFLAKLGGTRFANMIQRFERAN
jgi:predicted nucleic acid-binding protein